jgi:NitT/TauT family transport system permease protein
LSRGRRAIARVWPRLAAIGVVLALWWAVFATGFFDSTVLPSPLDAWESLRDHLVDGSIPAAVGKSLVRLAFGMAVAVVLGTLLGVGMAASPIVQRSLGSVVVALYSVPAIVWLPLAILWFGLTERAIVFVVIVGALPSIAMGTAASIRQVPPHLVRAGRTLGARGWVLYRRVVVPAAVPGYVAGLQQGWAFAWWSLLAGELISTGARGLGHFLETARQQFDVPTVFAIVAVIVVIGLVVDLAFAVLGRRVRARRGLATEGVGGG